MQKKKSTVMATINLILSDHVNVKYLSMTVQNSHFKKVKPTLLKFWWPLKSNKTRIYMGGDFER